MKTAQRTGFSAIAAFVMGVMAIGANAQSPPSPQEHAVPHAYGAAEQQKSPAVQDPMGEPMTTAPAHATPTPAMPSASAPAAKAPGPEQKWERGATLPKEYRSKEHVVSDWKAHGLTKPTPGHEWIQHGSNYMLIATATGKITEIHPAK